MSVSSVNSRTAVNGFVPPQSLRSPAELFGTKPVRNPYSQDAGLSRVTSEVSSFGVGALSGWKYQGTVVEAGKSFGNAVKTGGVKEVLSSIGSNGKVLGTAAYNAAGVGAILGGGVSLVTNGISLIGGNDSLRGASANVVTDTMKGALAGVGGMAGGGITAVALSAFKVTGTPLAIASLVGGAVGATVVNKYLNLEGLRDTLRGN